MPLSLGSSEIRPSSTGVRVLIKVDFVDERIALDGQDHSEEIAFKGQQSQEHNLKFRLVHDKINDTNELQPINTVVSLELKMDCQSGISCPLLHESIQTTYQWSVNVDLYSGCAIKNRCQCELEFNLNKTSLDTTTIVVNQDKALVLTFDLLNQQICII